MCRGREGGGKPYLPLLLQSSSLSSKATMRTVPSIEQERRIMPSADQEKSVVAPEGAREGVMKG